MLMRDTVMVVMEDVNAEGVGRDAGNSVGSTVLAVPCWAQLVPSVSN